MLAVNYLETPGWPSPKIGPPNLGSVRESEASYWENMWKCASTSGWKKYPAVIKHGLLGKPCQYIGLNGKTIYQWGSSPNLGENIHTILSPAEIPLLVPVEIFKFQSPAAPCCLSAIQRTLVIFLAQTSAERSEAAEIPMDFFCQKFTNQMGGKTSHLQVRSILVMYIYICTYTYNIYIYTYREREYSKCQPRMRQTKVG